MLQEVHTLGLPIALKPLFLTLAVPEIAQAPGLPSEAGNLYGMSSKF